MTDLRDLRDLIPEFEAAVRRLLDNPTGRLRLTIEVTPATCHPRRPLEARGLCKSCYVIARRNGTLGQHNLSRPRRSTADFAADYELLRSEGYTRRQIAERLGMARNTVDAAYKRGVEIGLITPDRRTA